MWQCDIYARGTSAQIASGRSWSSCTENTGKILVPQECKVPPALHIRTIKRGETLMSGVHKHENITGLLESLFKLPIIAALNQSNDFKFNRDVYVYGVCRKMYQE